MSCDSTFPPVFNDFQNLNSYPLIRADTYSKSGGNVNQNIKTLIFSGRRAGPQKIFGRQVAPNEV